MKFPKPFSFTNHRKWQLVRELFYKNMGSVCSKNITGTLDPSSMAEPKSSSEGFVEKAVCKVEDIKENEMKVYDLGEDVGKVLLVKQHGEISALGHKCTHYGAPLEKGALGDGRIRCQWHGACFNIKTGDIEDFPGLDSLPCYQVNIKNDEVIVKAKQEKLKTNKRIKRMHKRDENEARKIVVIGGGPSGATCVETLRQEGFTGSITLVCKEDALPYDRVKLSKALDIDVAKLQLRTSDFYKSHHITVLQNVEATQVDNNSKLVLLNNGDRLSFDHLYIATGCQARKLNIPGSDLRNVCTLRTFEDSHFINSLVHQEADVVILGVSFVGMEAAAYCADKCRSVTVIGRDNVPFKPPFGEQIGKRLMEMFEEKGVKFIMNNGIKECIGTDKLTDVKLNDDKTIKADVLIMGVGSSYFTDFLKNSEIELNQDGSVTVDQYLQTNIKGIYAGGDIAKAPVYVSDFAKATIGHYGLAHYHGRIAALNILDRNVPLKTVPYFFTMLFGKSIRYAGHGIYDDVQIYGSLPDLKFLAYYYKNDKVIAMASCTRDPVISQFAELLEQGKRIHRRDVESGDIPWSN